MEMVYLLSDCPISCTKMKTKKREALIVTEK